MIEKLSSAEKPFKLPEIYVAEGFDTVEDEDGNVGFGVYVPDKNQIYVAGDIEDEIRARALLHEVCHWVQDMCGRPFDEDEANKFSDIVYEALPSAQPECKTDGDTISRQAAIDEIRKCRFVVDAIEKIKDLPSVQPEQSSEIQGILDYLDTVLHPIVSPEHWDVYSELHDMISRLLSAQFEPNCKGCKHQPRFSHEEPCCTCANNYENKYER